MYQVQAKISENRFRKIGFSPKVWRCLDRADRVETRLITGTMETVSPLLEAARKIIAIANDATIARLLLKNPQIIQISPGDFAAGGSDGLLAILPLNDCGVQAITTGTFDGRDPDPDTICGPGEQPRAIYIWLVYMPGTFGRLLSAIAKALDPWLATPCPFFSNATNAHSERLHRSAGFMVAKDYYPECDPAVLVAFPQQEVSPRQSVHSTIKIARTIEEIFQVFSVRSATYIAEQFCLYSEEFDGNDFCATHFLGMIGGDAAGCVRLRFFNGFAKLERLAVRAEYRNSRLAYQLVRAALEHCRLKGYQKVYGHSRLDLVRFWRAFGFQRIADRPEFSFANVKYVEMLLDQPASSSALTLQSPPMMLIRPEGAWHEPGPFDLSNSANDPNRKQRLEARTRTIGKQKITA
jgi:predicted GNAT family N-acyltransferase